MKKKLCSNLVGVDDKLGKSHYKRYILFACLYFFTGIAFGQKSIFKADTVLSQMKKIAGWQINDWEQHGYKYAKTNWTYATAYTGIFALGQLDKGIWLPFLTNIGDSVGWNTGKNRFHADDYCIGQTFANLYKLYKQPEMIAAFKGLADSIVAQPHTEPLEWKNHIESREWAWCDALFMGPTALSYLYTATGEIKYLDIATKLWWKTTDYLYDTTEHLYFRDQSFFTKREKNGQKVFWSRGNGWVMAGLVRVLENMPKNYPGRSRFITLYKEMAERIAGLQQPDGTWHASLLDPESYPVKETSGTGFYTYAILWGINHGILSKKQYWPVVEKGWEALASSIHPNGMPGFVQAIGAAPGSVDYNSTETYGTGAFLLAGSEMYQYLTKR